ncbi:endochitinase A-like [Oryza brachyantha]|uniref:endochitinase A-like n=1 Tax=Oryza brachyantha TaxID=4533 RepID=UPI001AD9D2A5|nr:endochitinase A-like [Oryza brachyantha]
MDSGNSGGSLQSSSGGDDEFDSRGGVDSSPLSALLRPSASSAGFALHGSMYGFQELGPVGTSLHQQPPPQPQPQQGVSWSAAQFAAGVPSSSSPRVPQGADAGAGAGVQRQGDPSSAEGAGAAVAAVAAPARGSRKRTRASRRAPTTVLTTDTSNFRAMVQEFTGIPSPPFVAGVGAPAASLRTRFDHLFPSPASALRSAAAGAAADPVSSLPPYLLRPFAQKLPAAASSFPPFTSSSPSTSTPSSSNIGVANANANANATATTGTAAAATTATPVNAAAAGAGDAFQLTPAALLRMQQDATSSSYLSFPNVLGSSQPMFGGFGHGGARLHDTSPSPSFSEFLGGSGGSSSISLTDGGGLMSSETLHHLPPRNDAHHGGDELSGVVASGSGGGYGSCKLNYTPHAGASSSQAAASADKPPDTAGRGEGLDPWICTSE